MNIAIIGANGFIGTHLTEKILSEKEHRVFLFGKSDISKFANLPYQKMDFFDSEFLKRSFQNIDLVYYLASETIPATSWQNPVIEVEKNLIPFMRFMETVSTLIIKKIAYVSSAGTIYGATQGKVDEVQNKQPFSPYGIIKLTIENFLNYYKVKSGINFDVFRISNAYGEGQNTGKGLGIINTFLEKIITENKVQIYGDGKSTRNYIYVKDVAELMSLSYKNMSESGIYNISSSSTADINSLVEIMRSVTTEKFETVYLPSRQSDNSYIDLDNTRIQKKFPEFKFTSLNEGIKKTYTALKK